MTRYRLKTFTLTVATSEDTPPYVTGKQTSSPAAVIEIAKAILATLDEDQEHLVVLALNTKNRINGFKVLASGGVDRCYADMKILARAVVSLGATSIILFHNHPGGCPQPSQEDKQLTRSAAEVAKLLDMRLLDHIIIGQGTGDYFSFNEGGLICRA